ncbi:glyoxalase/bleomycin resistance/dioxygenase family protein [Halalkalibacterium halodurans]|uniref:VOC family protein n=1 Tax=Halalkalibacterium halodurans TaxID=86665 RepID=UPI002E1B553E|nr:glyoxalase/bleomycin resistance/dioxygenase family protein [Halalkalibacterium halodurans]
MNWDHVGMETSRLDETLKFYQTFFKFEEEQAITFQKENILFIRRGVIRLELIENQQASPPSQQLHICWRVPSLKKEMIRLQKLGLLPVEGPFAFDLFKTVFYKGPNNEIIELIQR